MELAGISRKVAMLISGHRTEEVYNRYRIVAESDLSAATRSMVGYYGEMAGKISEYSKKVTDAVTIEVEENTEAK